MNQKYKPDPKVTALIHADAKKALKKGELPVIVVVLNDRCYSACRKACTVLSALPNTVFVGDSISLKNPMGLYPSIGTVQLELITYSQVMLAKVNDKYKLKKPDYDLKYDSKYLPGADLCFKFFQRFAELRKLVLDRLKTAPRPYMHIQ